LREKQAQAWLLPAELREPAWWLLVAWPVRWVPMIRAVLPVRGWLPERVKLPEPGLSRGQAQVQASREVRPVCPPSRVSWALREIARIPEGPTWKPPRGQSGPAGPVGTGGASSRNLHFIGVCEGKSSTAWGGRQVNGRRVFGGLVIAAILAI